MTSIDERHQRFIRQSKWTKDLRHYILDQIGVNDTSRLLEVGSGTGAIIEQMTGIGNVHGLDIDFNSIDWSRRNVEGIISVQGDGLALPYQSNSFDICYCHYLLLWAQDPNLVLLEMKRVTKLGGWVIAFAEPDYGGRIDFPESMAQLGNLQTSALEERGANTRMGRKLAAEIHNLDLKNIEVGIMGSQKKLSGQQMDTAEQKIMAEDLRDLISAERLESLQAIENQAIQHGSRVNFVPTFYAYGQKG